MQPTSISLLDRLKSARPDDARAFLKIPELWVLDLVKDHYWIGSDPNCSLCRSDDLFCEPKHVRLHRTSEGTWAAGHNKTQNGIWLRMAQITIDGTIHFQFSEQRFRHKV